MAFWITILFGFALIVPNAYGIDGVRFEMELEKIVINVRFTENYFTNFYECLSNKSTQSCQASYPNARAVERSYLHSQLEPHHHTNYYICQTIHQDQKIVCIRQLKNCSCTQDAKSQIFHYVKANRYGSKCVGLSTPVGLEFRVLDHGDNTIQKCEYTYDSDGTTINTTVIVFGAVLGIIIIILVVALAFLLVRRKSTKYCCFPWMKLKNETFHDGAVLPDKESGVALRDNGSTSKEANSKTNIENDTSFSYGTSSGADSPQQVSKRGNEFVKGDTTENMTTTSSDKVSSPYEIPMDSPTTKASPPQANCGKTLNNGNNKVKPAANGQGPAHYANKVPDAESGTSQSDVKENAATSLSRERKPN